MPATPNGITTAAESKLAAGASTVYVASIYNLDGLLNSAGMERSIGVWVRVNTSGYVLGDSANWASIPMPANTWVWVQTISPFGASSHSGLSIRRPSGSGNALESDRAYITGVMSVAGSTPHSYADGSSPNWVWNGTPNNSTSTGPAL